MRNKYVIKHSMCISMTTIEKYFVISSRTIIKSIVIAKLLFPLSFNHLSKGFPLHQIIC